MNPDEMQAMKRLLKKLSALRATLSDDERALLDGFIVAPATDDVAAHVIDDATRPVMPPAPDEVAAHVLKPAVIARAAPGADEAAAGRKLSPVVVVFVSVKEIYRMA